MVSDQQLDAILFYIKKTTNLGASINANYIWNLYVNRTPELKIDKLLFDDILLKLTTDGYLTVNNNGVYHLTVDGRNFKGYVYTKKWFRKVSINKIVEGIIIAVMGALITTAIIWSIKK